MWLVFTAARLASAQAPANGQAPTNDDLTIVYNRAMAAFTTGDYKASASGLEEVIAKAPPDSKLEPAYYTLGAAYFNAGDYQKAVETLRTYRSKFPDSPRLAEANDSLGQAARLLHDNAGAIEAFKTLENNPAYREQALFAEAGAQQESGQLDDAIGTLDKLVAAGIHTNVSATAMLTLAKLYAEKKQPDKALAIIKQINQNVQLLDNVSQFNTLATETGDTLLAQQLPKDALVCYQAVRTRGEVVRLQTNRIATLRAELTRQLTAIRTDPKNAPNLFAANNRLKALLNDATALLADFQKLPDYEPALLTRLAACYTQMQSAWEALVVYEEVLRRYPGNPDTRESALYGVISASSGAGRDPAKTHQLCDRYLKEFPRGPNADTVGYLQGALAVESNDPKGAETYFGQRLEGQGGGTYRELMIFQLANAQFTLGELDKAQETYAQYRREFPDGRSAEEASYRIALCAVFAGAYEKAIGLFNDYVRLYPGGHFVPDARYRLGVCMLAASQYDEVIARCKAWENDYKNGPLLGEVLALEGDAFAAKDDNAAALDAYLRSYKAATSDEVSDYSLFAAQKLLQEAGDWERMAQMFEEFVRDHPERPSAITAVYWIARADARVGKTEEAKHFIADTIKKYIDDPKRDAVEQLLTQLATLCAKRQPPTPAVVSDASPSPAAERSSSPPAAPADAGKEMDQLLGGAEIDASPLARARVLFAKSELARMRRQIPAQEQNLESLATTFKPTDLDAPLLAIAGDYLMGKGRYEQAAPLFDALMASYPKSDELDYAYNGLGEIAYQRKDYPAALRYFTDAVDKAGAATKLKDVTVGRAKTLLAMGRLDEAQKLFEQVASTREWRGEATAQAVYSLGDIERERGKLPEAIVYYQRVYVAYQRFLPWVAKAYVASAECFAQLGKSQEALNTYREMLKNSKLQDFAEAQKAREYLQKNSQG